AGFTVKLPGRKSLEAAAPLAARDSRIAAIKVTNEPSGAELTVTFRDGVPNYHVSARGDTLLIALAPAGALERTVAKRDDRGEVGAGAAHGKRSREDSRSPSASGAPRDEGGRAGAAALPPRGGDTTPER
ncbi:MAG TPA: hypothetical protein VE987_04290, partial [Polyangiaceae bacterium]|nr:hypothetical protein [Polyangiaceae bacterium]